MNSRCEVGADIREGTHKGMPLHGFWVFFHGCGWVFFLYLFLTEYDADGGVFVYSPNYFAD